MSNQLRCSIGWTAGLVLFGFQIYAFCKAHQSVDWPMVPGKVTASTIERTSLRNYSRIVNYEYHVDGKQYSATRVRFGGFDFGSQLLGKKSSLDKYPRGKAVEVHYNPNDPAEAVLETAFPPSAYLLMLIAMVICACSSLPLFANLRAKDSAHGQAMSTA